MCTIHRRKEKKKHSQKAIATTNNQKKCLCARAKSTSLYISPAIIFVFRSTLLMRNSAAVCQKTHCFILFSFVCGFALVIAIKATKKAYGVLFSSNNLCVFRFCWRCLKHFTFVENRMENKTKPLKSVIFVGHGALAWDIRFMLTWARRKKLVVPVFTGDHAKISKFSWFMVFRTLRPEISPQYFL